MWRVGTTISRVLYKDNEPIAMLATAELASELATKLNENGDLTIKLNEALENINRLEKQKELFYLIMPDIQSMKMRIRELEYECQSLKDKLK